MHYVTKPALLLLVAVACIGCKPSPSDKSIKPGDDELVAQATAAVSEMDRLRREAMAGAEGKIYPRPDLGACPVKYEHYVSGTSALPGQSKEATGFLDIPPYDAARGDDFLENMRDITFAISGLGLASGEEVAIKPGPRMLMLKDSAREKARNDYDRTRLRERADKTQEVNDFELVIDKEIMPKVTSETEFEPGLLRGRFYVWDYSKSAIVCMARVLVVSSEKLRIQVRGPAGSNKAELDEKWQAGLRGDLREQALVQAKDRLFPAGPLPSDDEDINKEGDGGTKDGGHADAGTKIDAGRADAGKIGLRDAGAH